VTALLVALAAFGWRIHEPKTEVTALAHDRRVYMKVLLLGYAVWFATFQAVGRVAMLLPAHDVTTAVDRWVPYVPEMVWPYEMCYLMPFLALVVVRDFHRFNRAFLAILLASAGAYAIYLLFPVAFPRPSVGTSLSERVLAMEHAIDVAANNLPSLHVALSVIMGRAMHGQSGRKLVDVAIWLAVAAITASTVLIKQHMLIDSAAGLAWGWGAYLLAGRIYARRVAPGVDAQEGLRQLFRPRRRTAIAPLLLVAILGFGTEGRAHAGAPAETIERANRELQELIARNDEPEQLAAGDQ
jgi:hypothetical protein